MKESRSQLTVRHSPSEEWDSFVVRSPDRSPFLRSPWLETYSAVFGHEVRRIVASSDAGIIAGLAFQAKRKSGFIVSPHFPIAIGTGLVSAGDATADPALMTEAKQLLLTHIQNTVRFVSFTTFVDSPELTRYSRRWSWMKQRTARLSLVDANELWNGFQQSLRRKIRRAQEQNFQFTEGGDPAQLVELHGQSYARQLIEPPMEKALLTRWCTALAEKKLIRVFSVTDCDRPIAMRAIVCDGSMTYDWLAGSDPTALESNATHFLVWKILEQLSAEQFETFDFMGLNTPGPAQFKEAFGGRQVEYRIANYYSSPLIRQLESVRAFFTRRARGL